MFTIHWSGTTPNCSDANPTDSQRGPDQRQHAPFHTGQIGSAAPRKNTTPATATARISGRGLCVTSLIGYLRYASRGQVIQRYVSTPISTDRTTSAPSIGGRL